MITTSDYAQLSLFAETNNEIIDPRDPITVTWNMHHGCTNYVEDYITCVMCFDSYVGQSR